MTDRTGVGVQVEEVSCSDVDVVSCSDVDVVSSSEEEVEELKGLAEVEGLDVVVSDSEVTG